MTIKIKGVIGYEVVGHEFSNMISRLDGDLKIEIDSPGGFLSDGITIFNAIEGYTKGKKDIVVVGQASSMAAYIMLAGDTLAFKSNATVVLHNPSNVCWGDYKAMLKNADILERFSALYANKFVEKGIFSEKEIRAIMDEETYFIGEKELCKLGNVIKAQNDDPQEDRETAIQIAKEHIKACEIRMKEFDCGEYEKVAALLPAVHSIRLQTATGIAPAIFKYENTQVIQEKENIKMKTLEELKAQAPDVYAQAVALGREKESKRVKALMTFIDDDKDEVIAAIDEGKSILDEEVMARLLRAKANNQTIASMQDDNPPAVNPKEAVHAPENDTQALEDEKKQQKKKEEEALNEVLAYMGFDDNPAA